MQAMIVISKQKRISTMAQQGSVHIYHNMADAEDAVKPLIDQTPADEIYRDAKSRNREAGAWLHYGRRYGSTGRWNRRMGGRLIGLLVGAAFIFIPGFGPLVVARSFAAASKYK
jgi:hypothetical protein